MLRFDYTHHEALSREQLEEVEEIVNVQVLADTVLNVAECSLDEARSRGAKALFDEKYGEAVRVVTVPGFSSELCGGLHVRATGEVGLFKILREESVGSGTRRVTAVTGMNALTAFRRVSHLTTRTMELLSADESNLAAKLEELLEETRRLQRQLQEARLKELTQDAERIFERKDVGGVILQTGKFDSAQPEMLRGVGDRAKGRCSPTVVVMVSLERGECRLTVMADDAAVAKGVNAGTLVKEAAALLGGRGGGRPSMAQGGGKDAARLDEALAKIEVLLKSQTERAPLL